MSNDFENWDNTPNAAPKLEKNLYVKAKEHSTWARKTVRVVWIVTIPLLAWFVWHRFSH